MLRIVDRPEQIAKLLPRLDELVDEGLIAMSDVDAIRFFPADEVRPNER